MFFTFPPQVLTQRIEWEIGTYFFFFFMNYKNLMFILQIQNSHPASFFLFTLNCCKSVPWYKLLRAAQDVPNISKPIHNFSRTKTSMCFDSLSDELNMQTSRLRKRLMDYITYGFFESIKNKANHKVHQTQNKIPVRDQQVCVKVSSLLSPLSTGSLSTPLQYQYRP